jgi:hypothetical protein
VFNNDAAEERRMGKAGRTRKRRLRTGKGKVTKFNNGRKGRAKPKKEPLKEPVKRKVKRKLTAEQTLAVQLMQARQVIRLKNDHIARMQIKYSDQVTALAGQISSLEAELKTTMAQLMGANNDVENRENESLAKKYGLPTGTVEYSMGPDGCFTFEEEVVEEPEPEPEPGPEPEPEPEPEASTPKPEAAESK